MGGYIKNIAVIKTLKSGFSADGGPLSGLIKCEKYGNRFHAEISFINFAPLSEGRYVCAVSDGINRVIIENGYFDGESNINISGGFAALICFANKTVQSVAGAVCGKFAFEVSRLAQFIAVEEATSFGERGKKTENKKGDKKEKAESYNTFTEYNDEAIAEENYYEQDFSFKERNPLRQNKKEKEGGRCVGENEKNIGAFKAEQSGIDKIGLEQSGLEHEACAFPDEWEGEFATFKKESLVASAEREKTYESNGANDGGENGGGKNDENGENYSKNGVKADSLAHGEAFYEQVKEEVERVLSSYPKEESLCSVVQNSNWVKINYGDEKFYVFGVIYGDKTPKYICYGVPSKSATPPKSMKNLATFIPADRFNASGKGFWVMYQDAATGASITVNAV